MKSDEIRPSGALARAAALLFLAFFLPAARLARSCRARKERIDMHYRETKRVRMIIHSSTADISLFFIFLYVFIYFLLFSHPCPLSKAIYGYI